MTTQYTCELCKKVFNQKVDYTRHKNKKTPCISLQEIQQLTHAKETNTDNKNVLIDVFKSCLNILRDNEGLTGEKALRNLSYLLILKLLEPHFENEIDIDNFNYDFESYFEEDVINYNKKRLLKIIRFTNLSNEKEDDIPNLMKYVWDIILSVHPSTKNIFLKGKGFDIQHKSTYKKLIDKLNTVDLKKSDYDILGNAYEEVIQHIMTGRVLGQFFTQPLVKKMMVNLINPQIHLDGTIDTCGDPTMGTGGFLITYLQYILEQAKLKNIKPNWEFIKTEGLYGKELEPDTYQLAVSNMLISSGHMFEELDRGDSIREPITRKFDNILANPPFGIKGLKYDDFQSSLKSEYVPIKTDNAVSLFIQAIIYMLKINGKCAVVLPDGQDLFSKTNTTLVSIREYLMKTCDLKEIIYLPSGIFTYTTIKTCVFYFVKKREGTDVLKTEIKISKAQKKTEKNYNFTKTHQTTTVKFYDYNPYTEVKNLLVEVPIENIVNNSYSLNYAEYIKDETEEEQYDEGIVVKTLGEVCKFLPKSKRNAKYGNKEGLYPFFKSSIKVDCYVDEPDYDEESLIIGDGGEPNINYGIKFSTSDHCYILQNKNKLLLNLKYVYYYLYHNLEMMSQLYTGVAIKNISKTNIEGIKIPIPSLNKQQEVVQYLDFIYEKANKTSNEKIAELKQLNEFCLNNQKIFGENVVKTLGELFKLNGNGKTNSKDITNTGEYPFYKASYNNPSGTHNTFDFDGKEYLLIIKSGGSSSKPISENYGIGKVFIVNGKCAANIAVFQLLPKTNENFKYLFYYLKSIQNKIQALAKYCTNNGNIDMKELMEIKIQVPSIERQKEIVEYCEHNDILIKQLEKEIENNKNIAQQFITNIIKSNNSNSNNQVSNNIIFIEQEEEEDDDEEEIEEIIPVIKNKK
jgi:type I restriction enzyme M protein